MNEFKEEDINGSLFDVILVNFKSGDNVFKERFLIFD